MLFDWTAKKFHFSFLRMTKIILLQEIMTVFFEHPNLITLKQETHLT